MLKKRKTRLNPLYKDSITQVFLHFFIHFSVTNIEHKKSIRNKIDKKKFFLTFEKRSFFLKKAYNADC